MYYSNVGDGINDIQCWIGLYKSVAEVSDNSTYWLDGNPSTYRNWDDGEPNSLYQCVRIENGKFTDGACNRLYRYVCKGVYFYLKVIFSVIFSLVLFEVD